MSLQLAIFSPTCNLGLSGTTINIILYGTFMNTKVDVITFAKEQKTFYIINVM
jgi:hypothetical protein